MLCETLKNGSFGLSPGDIHSLEKYWFSRPFDDDNHAPEFTIKLLKKDIDFVLSLCRSIDVDSVLASFLSKEIEDSILKGWLEDSTTSIRRLQEERYNVKLGEDDQHSV